MKSIRILAAAMIVTAPALVGAGQAEAAGCLSGAAVGGAAGHFAGHHAVLGAAAGCAVGHHEANKQAAVRNQQQNTQPTSTGDQPVHNN